MAGRRQRELENFGHRLLTQGVGPSQAGAQALRVESQRRHNPLPGGRTQGQNFSAPSDQPRQIPYARVRKATAVKIEGLRNLVI
jgi:hypothetical protein